MLLIIMCGHNMCMFSSFFILVFQLSDFIDFSYNFKELRYIWILSYFFFIPLTFYWKLHQIKKRKISVCHRFSFELRQTLYFLIQWFMCFKIFYLKGQKMVKDFSQNKIWTWSVIPHHVFSRIFKSFCHAYFRLSKG